MQKPYLERDLLLHDSLEELDRRKSLRQGPEDWQT